MPKHPEQAALIWRLLASKQWGDQRSAERRLSDEAHIHPSLVRRYVSGEVAIGAKNAPALARALGVTLEVLLRADGAHAA